MKNKLYYIFLIFIFNYVINFNAYGADIFNFDVKELEIIEEGNKFIGKNGGTATSGSWQTRDLNTEIADPSGIVSISANEFTLAAGNYLITWSAPAGDVRGHQSRLYDVTGTAEVGVGTSEYSYTDYDGETRSMGALRVTPSGSNVYRIEHRVNTTKADRGYGTGTGWGVEQYTMVEIYKES